MVSQEISIKLDSDQFCGVVVVNVVINLPMVGMVVTISPSLSL